MTDRSSLPGSQLFAPVCRDADLGGTYAQPPAVLRVVLLSSRSAATRRERGFEPWCDIEQDCADCDCACFTNDDRDPATVLSAPILYSLELTSTCNNRCIGCGNVFADNRTPQPLSAARWREILVSLRPHIHRLKLTGGEPTLHPEFDTVVATLQEFDISFALFTNARWRDPARLVAFLQTAPQCRGMLVSLHGSASASHDAFTGMPGSFDETCANICHAVAAGLNVTTSTVITSHNWHEVGDIVCLSQELGANHAVFNRYLGKSLPQIEPTEDQLHQAVEAIDNLRSQGDRVKFGNCVPQCFHPSSSTGCLAGVAYCTVDPWGNVRPCNHAPLICGNLLEQSIEEIWYGAAMNRWREMIPEQCLYCLKLPRCHGGCRAVAMIQGLETDPLMRNSVLERELEPPEALILYEGAIPVGRYGLRAQDFGYVLVRGNRIVPVAAAAKSVLDACDGCTTLRQI
jgi:radical SAM protein with 4Fe4S-binding SPASM domain